MTKNQNNKKFKIIYRFFKIIVFLAVIVYNIYNKMNNILSEKLKLLPTNCGVYLMKNCAGNIIYVGKAKNLKNRVKQYFIKGNSSVKVNAMVEKITDLEYIITPDEVNAYVLENNLIKKYKPHFNIMLKDDKQYPYIKIDMSQVFPKIEVVRKFSKKHNVRYYGPYMQGISVREVIDTVNSIFCLRTCNNNIYKLFKNHRACLNYHIGKCVAPCTGEISPIEYSKRVNGAMDFLSGNDNKAINIVKTEMFKASEREDYEQALLLRQRLEILNKLERKQIAAIPKNINADVFSIASDEDIVSISLMVVRGGKILGADTVNMEIAEEDKREALERYIVAYYDKNQLSADEILTNIPLKNISVLSCYLIDLYNLTKLTIISPIKGKKKQLTDMAYVNARNSMENYINNSLRKKRIAEEALKELSEYTGIKDLHRIECYDNSNISGTSSVSAMTVFIEGEPKNSYYRKFKVKTVKGSNDYETMYEILTRRFIRLKETEENKDISFNQSPSLIILDGGRGQLSYGYKAMEEQGVNVPIMALAEREELLYTRDLSEPILLPPGSLSYNLVKRIRDETHRFAITYHRSYREKKQTESELIKLKGVGKRRVKILFEHFNNMEEIKNASIEQLGKVNGIPIDVARTIYNYFNKEE